MSKFFHVSVEGGLAAGKTTFMNRLKEIITKRGLEHIIAIFEEPLNVWCEFGTDRVNLLKNMYDKEPRAAVNFQTIAMASKVAQLSFTCPINIVERSLLSQRELFIKMLYDQNQISKLEFEILNFTLNAYLTNTYLVPNLYIYFQLDPEESLIRVKHRNRGEEQKVNLSYLIDLNKRHQQWLLDKPNAWVYRPDEDLDPEEILDRILKAYHEM